MLVVQLRNTILCMCHAYLFIYLFLYIDKKEQDENIDKKSY